jgi:hypothetical protein
MLHEPARRRMGKTTFNALVRGSIAGPHGADIQAVLGDPPDELRGWLSDGSLAALRGRPPGVAGSPDASWLLARFRTAAVARWVAAETGAG